MKGNDTPLRPLSARADTVTSPASALPRAQGKTPNTPLRPLSARADTATSPASALPRAQGKTSNTSLRPLSARADTATSPASALPRAQGRRRLRLLPAVVIVGTALLGFRASDLIHSAYAAADGTTGLSADLTAGPVPANPDYAGTNDDSQASAADVDVQGAMAKRRRELDMRQDQIANQAKMLAAAEQRVDTKIAQLEKLQATITALLGQRDAAQKAQIAALVKTYSNMKPKDAARIFNTLPDDVLVPVAQEMKADVLGTVLASMNPDNARTLTVKLANRLTLPETTDALAPATPQTQPVQAAKTAAAPQAAPPQGTVAKTGG